MKKYKVKTLIMSDLHLGSAACNVEAILGILKEYSFDTLILNGDIIDFENLSMSRNSWKKEHTEILKKFLKFAQKENKNIVYVTGNHDAVLRDFGTLFLDKILVCDRYEYVSEITGKKILFMHGDDFDFFIKNNRLITLIGIFGYDFLVKLNRYFNKIRKLFGLQYWSISKYIKKKVKEKICLLKNFDHLCASFAKEHKFDGICVGHIHIPEKIKIDDILYLNSGDMCETASFIIENNEGEFEILYY